VKKYQQTISLEDESAYKLSKHLDSKIDGPKDLATNKKYLEGFRIE
jgi:hypothetical protein